MVFGNCLMDVVSQSFKYLIVLGCLVCFKWFNSTCQLPLLPGVNKRLKAIRGEGKEMDVSTVLFRFSFALLSRLLKAAAKREKSLQTWEKLRRVSKVPFSLTR